jgi:hypothetical protein
LFVTSWFICPTNNTEALLKNLNVKMAEQLTKLLQAGLVDKFNKATRDG